MRIHRGPRCKQSTVFSWRGRDAPRVMSTLLSLIVEVNHHLEYRRGWLLRGNSAQIFECLIPESNYSSQPVQSHLDFLDPIHSAQTYLPAQYQSRTRSRSLRFAKEYRSLAKGPSSFANNILSKSERWSCHISSPCLQEWYRSPYWSAQEASRPQRRSRASGSIRLSFSVDTKGEASKISKCASQEGFGIIPRSD